MQQSGMTVEEILNVIYKQIANPTERVYDSQYLQNKSDEDLVKYIEALCKNRMTSKVKATLRELVRRYLALKGGLIQCKI